jgi:ribose 5-phosphate isomerase B
MKLYIAADHAGYELKQSLIEHLKGKGVEIEDLGAHTLEPNDDYPRYAYALTVKILGEEDPDGAHGVLICGSGQGMSIAANRVRGIRAALAWDEESAKSAREDDGANVLVLPSRHLDVEQAAQMVKAYVSAKMKSDPKYHRRLDEVEELYG